VFLFKQCSNIFGVVKFSAVFSQTTEKKIRLRLQLKSDILGPSLFFAKKIERDISIFNSLCSVSFVTSETNVRED
jgi:hypothetical protein